MTLNKQYYPTCKRELEVKERGREREIFIPDSNIQFKEVSIYQMQMFGESEKLYLSLHFHLKAILFRQHYFITQKVYI